MLGMPVREVLEPRKLVLAGPEATVSEAARRSNVRRMAPTQTDVVRRFTWLVDVFYDQRVKLVLSADAQPEDLVAEAPEADPPARMVRREFARTASRLREMQSKDYFGRKHASADDPGLLSAT